MRWYWLCLLARLTSDELACRCRTATTLGERVSCCTATTSSRRRGALCVTRVSAPRGYVTHCPFPHPQGAGGEVGCGESRQSDRGEHHYRRPLQNHALVSVEAGVDDDVCLVVVAAIPMETGMTVAAVDDSRLIFAYAFMANVNPDWTVLIRVLLMCMYVCVYVCVCVCVCVCRDSGLGRRCVIGDSVRIEGSYLWDDVQVPTHSPRPPSVTHAGCLN